MSDLASAILQAAILLGVWIFLIILRRKSKWCRQGWYLITAGLGFTFIGCLLGISERTVSIGLVWLPASANLTQMWLILAVNICGLISVAIGFILWFESIVSEEHLHEIDREYFSIIELTSDWLWEVNDKMEFTHVGPMAKKLLGYDEKELIGRTPLSILPEEDAPLVWKMFEDYSALKKSFNGFECAHLGADGRVVYFEICGVPIVNENGKLMGYRGVNKDITVRKKAEIESQHRMELEKHVARLSSVFARLQSHEIDKYINDALRRIGSFSEVDRCYIFIMRDGGTKMDNTHEWCAEGIEPQIANLQDITLDDLPWFSRHIRKNETVCIESVDKLPKEARIEREHFRRQSIKSLLVMPMVIGDELKGFAGFDSVKQEKQWSEEIRHLLGIMCDIVINSIERTSREDALRASEQRYRLLAENSSDVIWTSDLDLNLGYVSPSVQRLMGMTANDAINTPVEEQLTPTSVKNVLQIIHDILTENPEDSRLNDRPISAEVEFYRNDGSTVWTEVNATVIRDENGRPTGLVGVTRDISERKKYEAELRRARDTAEAANRSKSEFLANMSHEIRTPMTAILGFADILLEDYGENEKLDAARTIKRNGEHLLAIINDILDLSKIEAGKIIIEEIQVSPIAIMAEVCSLMRVRADAKGLSFSVECGGSIPEMIRTDPTRLRQILINVIGNAIKFTEMGSVKLVVALIYGGLPAPKLEFRVEDTGIGMSEEQIEGLFHAFSQADSSITRKYGGTGLGLTLSKRFAEMLGGDISAESRLGWGSTFIITVATGPLENVKLIQGSHEPGWLCVESQEKMSPNNVILKSRVLLAEDGPDNQRIISFLLRKAGAEVTVVENGKEAVDAVHESCAKNSPYDIVLMDMQMPIMDGYDAARQLRREGYDGNIIALTAHAMSGDREKCIAAGCNGYLTKPIDRNKMICMLERHSKSTNTPAGFRK